MARLLRGIKLFAMVAFVEAIAPVVAGAGAAAQAPDEDWRTLTTEHFRVTFPASLEALGRRAGARAEDAYAKLTSWFPDPPGGRIDLLLTDHTDLTNGFARVTPSNRITIFARPPVQDPSLSFFDDWLELVITHELAHVMHLDHTETPLGSIARRVFGRAEDGWPFFPATDMPVWVVEGLATWYESRLTHAGRLRGTFHEMVLRTAVLEGRFETLGQASGASPIWPGGIRSYAYGSMFFDHLLERYGEDRMAAFVSSVASQWIPFRLDAAGRSAFGVPLSDAWSSWAEELRRRYRDDEGELRKLGPLTKPERLTNGARWALYPSVSPDGATLVYTRADGRSDVQLRRQDPGTGPSEIVSRTNGLATYSWLPDGRLLFSQLEQADPYRAYGDLYLMDLDGEIRRLTRRARLDQPSVGGNGRWAVALQGGDGTNAIVRVDLETGDVSPLVPPAPDVHWAFPRVSPDGRWIAATRWEGNAYHDIVLLDARHGGELSRVTRDRALDLAPAWGPDSRWLVWSSDRTGVMNVLGAEIDPETGRAGVAVLLTNVATGVAYPSLDPSGRWIYVSGYHVDGWEAERVPFDPEAFGPAPPAEPRFDPPSDWDARGEAGGAVERYSPWPTLLPRYWKPRYRDPVTAVPLTAGGAPPPRREVLPFGLGAETSSSDLVGRHGYGAYVHVFTGGSKAEGGIGYAFHGLGNPVLSVSSEQTWSSAGGRLASPIPDTLYVLERERRLDADVTFSSMRWRRSASVTVGGGLVWEARQLLDSDLERSSRHSLTRPTSRLAETRVSAGWSTVRTHAFQTGASHGFNASVSGRRRAHLGLPAADRRVAGVDRSFDELSGRVRGYVPLWRRGHATHVLALQLTGGAAFGPDAQFGHFGVGGANGAPEGLTGFELFGGRHLFLPVRGFAVSSRVGRYAWAGSAEYRFPIALLHRGLGPWPLHFDRVIGTLFADTGNAWNPNSSGGALASVGAEITIQLLGFFRSGLQLRTGVAAPLTNGDGLVAYVRAGLPF